MRGFQAAWFFLSVFDKALTVAATSTEDSSGILNFHSFDVIRNNSLYFWVGSYFNGTAHLEFLPYAGLAASETGGCPVLRNKTITKDYETVLALTEPSTYNTDNDPLNSFLTLWPLGTDLSTVSDKLVYGWSDSDQLDWGIYSSRPVFSESSPEATNYFIWSLEKTQAPPYNLSSTLTDYPGDLSDRDGANYSLQVNASAADCNGTEISSWQFTPMTSNTTYKGTKFANPVISLQFDGQTANLSMKGYFSATPEETTQPVSDAGSPNTFAGQFTMTFSGVIDSYHSDVLRNDTATPTWLRTVGYGNNSLNIGYADESKGNQAGLLSLNLIMCLVLVQMLLLFC